MFQRLRELDRPALLPGKGSLIQELGLDVPALPSSAGLNKRLLDDLPSLTTNTLQDFIARELQQISSQFSVQQFGRRLGGAPTTAPDLILPPQRPDLILPTQTPRGNNNPPIDAWTEYSIQAPKLLNEWSGSVEGLSDVTQKAVDRISNGVRLLPGRGQTSGRRVAPNTYPFGTEDVFGGSGFGGGGAGVPPGGSGGRFGGGSGGFNAPDPGSFGLDDFLQTIQAFFGKVSAELDGEAERIARTKVARRSTESIFDEAVTKAKSRKDLPAAIEKAEAEAEEEYQKALAEKTKIIRSQFKSLDNYRKALAGATQALNEAPINSKLEAEAIKGYVKAKN